MLAVSQIWVYPFKSAQGISLSSTIIDAEGIVDDRRLVALDSEGRFLTARRYAELLQLSCVKTATGWHLQHPALSEGCEISGDGLSSDISGVIWKDSISAVDAGDDAADWLSKLLKQSVRIALWRPTARHSQKYALDTSFADASPILLATEESVEQACAWAGIPADVRRFRPNIVVSGAEAFAEDSWRRLRIGQLTFRILDPCERCILTTRDPDTGEKHPDKQPMQALKNCHAGPEGEPLFGMNMVLEQAALDSPLMISTGDAVELLT
jgi:uncharacterized protein YcbX